MDITAAVTHLTMALSASIPDEFGFNFGCFHVHVPCHFLSFCPTVAGVLVLVLTQKDSQKFFQVGSL